MSILSYCFTFEILQIHEYVTEGIRFDVVLKFKVMEFSLLRKLQFKEIIDKFNDLAYVQYNVHTIRAMSDEPFKALTYCRKYLFGFLQNKVKPSQKMYYEKSVDYSNAKIRLNELR